MLFCMVMKKFRFTALKLIFTNNFRTRLFNNYMYLIISSGDGYNTEFPRCAVSVWVRLQVRPWFKASMTQVEDRRSRVIERERPSPVCAHFTASILNNNKFTKLLVISVRKSFWRDEKIITCSIFKRLLLTNIIPAIFLPSLLLDSAALSHLCPRPRLFAQMQPWSLTLCRAVTAVFDHDPHKIPRLLGKRIPRHGLIWLLFRPGLINAEKLP